MSIYLEGDNYDDLRVFHVKKTEKRRSQNQEVAVADGESTVVDGGEGKT